MSNLKENLSCLLFQQILFQLEIKPYIMDDQQCDNCHGKFCARIPAPLFCPDITCLQYYCEICWTLMHQSTNENSFLRTLHKPFDKRMNV